MDGYQPENSSIPVSIMRKNLAGGAAQEVLRQTGIFNIQCARIPSRLCLFNTQVAGTTTFFSFDPEHGKGHEVARMTETGEGANWSLSPNGLLLAVVKFGEHEGRIRFISLPGGAVRDVVLRDWPRHSTVDCRQMERGCLCQAQLQPPLLCFYSWTVKETPVCSWRERDTLQLCAPSRRQTDVT